MLSERLATHRLVTRVRYPELASHPTHETAKRVVKGFGSIISFDLPGGSEFADGVCRNVKAHPPILTLKSSCEVSQKGYDLRGLWSAAA